MKTNTNINLPKKENLNSLKGKTYSLSHKYSPSKKLNIYKFDSLYSFSVLLLALKIKKGSLFFHKGAYFLLTEGNSCDILIREYSVKIEASLVMDFLSEHFKFICDERGFEYIKNCYF